jgi:hypothetical protein
VPELDDTGQPTGYAQGMCISFGRVPADDAFQIGQPVPQANCPYGAVIVPVDDGASDGDVGYCERQCASSADCRLGYGCYFFVDGMGGQTSTGFCDAINCLDPEFAAMPNNRCPNGYACQSVPTDAGMPEGICVRAAADGGVGDAGGTDASAGRDTGADGGDAGAD